MTPVTTVPSRNAQAYMQTQSNLEDCRQQLREVLEEWVLLRLRRNLPLPAIEGIDLTVKDVAV